MKRVLVVTSCTGKKRVDAANSLRIEDVRKGSAHVASREKDLAGLLTPAEDLYSGQQHTRLMRGVKRYRDAQPDGQDRPALELHILSAGYGLVAGSDRLAPYEATFQGMKSGELRVWADELGLPAAIRQLLCQPYDLALLLLGDAYLTACNLDPNVNLAGPTMLFCGSRMAKKLPTFEQCTLVPLSNQHAKRFSCGLVGLKGELAARMLVKLADKSTSIEHLADQRSEGLLDLLDGAEFSKSKKPKPKVNPKVDVVIQIPRVWHEYPHRSSMRYFIPDWDDQVDPDYDFENDEHSGGSGDWSNQVYAHQLLEEPAYDGILVSKVVAEHSKKKKRRVNEMGIHRFLRVPRSFPVMGDCGAFGYIKEKVPPFSTPEILDYYTRLDFDYGVSIDHLIVTETEEDARSRYELTISNAEEFLKEHRARGLKWVPIGAVQGWDASSYAEAARQYVEMGYRYIALGGLVRTSTKKLLPILQAVTNVIPSDVNVHLFGVARENAIADLRRSGISSVDSASVLRKAWLGSDKNYLTEKGWRPAIRIPEVNGSFRAKRLVASGTVSETDLRKLETSCLRLIRKHASSKSSSVSAKLVSALTEYDALIAGHRKSVEDRIRRTLEERPWEKCPCSICRHAGVEVIIFRGNNRNRRRGFHNTYTFYRLFKKAVMTAETASRTPAQPGLFQVGCAP